MTYSPPLREGTTEVKMVAIPPCDLCGRPAAYDAFGRQIRQWAYLCDDCAEVNQVHLGTGCGQRLILL